MASCLRGGSSRFPPHLESKCLWSSLGGHRDRHRWQTNRVVPQESLRPSAIFLPAFAQPRPHGSLDPELFIMEQFPEELEWPIEFPRPDKSMERIRRCASPPDVLRTRPAEEISESGG